MNDPGELMALGFMGGFALVALVFVLLLVQVRRCPSPWLRCPALNERQRCRFDAGHKGPHKAEDLWWTES